MEQKVDQMVDLDDTVVHLGASDVPSESDRAIECGKHLLQLYDEVKASDMKYAKTCYDMFQIHIMRDETLPQAQPFIEKAYQHARRFTSYDEHDIVLMYKELSLHPESHENYRAHAADDNVKDTVLGNKKQAEVAEEEKNENGH